MWKVEKRISRISNNSTCSLRILLLLFKLTENPINNYSLFKNGEYSFFVPDELIDTYEDFLPPELLMPKGE